MWCSVGRCGLPCNTLPYHDSTLQPSTPTIHLPYSIVQYSTPTYLPYTTHALHLHTLPYTKPPLTYFTLQCTTRTRTYTAVHYAHTYPPYSTLQFTWPPTYRSSRSTPTHPHQQQQVKHNKQIKNKSKTFMTILNNNIQTRWPSKRQQPKWHPKTADH